MFEHMHTHACVHATYTLTHTVYLTNTCTHTHAYTHTLTHTVYLDKVGLVAESEAFRVVLVDCDLIHAVSRHVEEGSCQRKLVDCHILQHALCVTLYACVYGCVGVCA